MKINNLHLQNQNARLNKRKTVKNKNKKLNWYSNVGETKHLC